MTKKKSHPLDGCDPADCYKTMMAERTALVTARQDIENHLVRTVIQIASALIVLMAGFVTQKSLDMDCVARIIFSCSLIGLVISIIAGLGEHWFASQAYLSQQIMMEDYYNKKISKFSDPIENKHVKRCQLFLFLSFILALVLLSVLAVIQTGVISDEPTDHPPPAAAAAAAAPTAPTAAAPAAAPAAAAPTATN
jgi:hypothetical protein